MEFTGTAQSLAWSRAIGVFAGVMNHHDGQLELALEFAQIREQRGDLGGIIFIHPVQANEWVEDQQDGALLLHSVREALPVGGGVQPERWGDNDLNRQRGKGDLSGRRDTFKPLTHDRQRVFGWKKQHRSATSYWELPQTGSTGSNADSDIQSQEAFAAFGLAAEDADGLLGPELLDQPLSLRAGVGQLTGALDEQRVHGFLVGLGSRVKTSK